MKILTLSEYITWLQEEMGGGVNMSTLGSTPGMGSVVPPGPGNIKGSGDRLDNGSFEEDEEEEKKKRLKKKKKIKKDIEDMKTEQFKTFTEFLKKDEVIEVVEIKDDTKVVEEDKAFKTFNEFLKEEIK